MKKLSFIGAIALVLGASSCTKTHEPQSGELVKVTFNVAALDVNVESMTKSTNTASTGLEYLVMNLGMPNGTFKEIKQRKSTNPDEFGTIELWLSPGTYTAYVAGYVDYTDGIGMINRTDDGFIIDTYNTDTFIYASGVTIDAENNNVDVTLSRYTGKLVVQLTDESVPDDVKGIKYEFNNYCSYYIQKGYTSKGKAISESVMKSNGAFPEYGFYMYESPVMPLTISVLGENNAILGSTSLDIQIMQNKRTIVRGNILDIVTEKGLTIKYTDDWGTDVIVPLQ